MAVVLVAAHTTQAAPAIHTLSDEPSMFEGRRNP
jgi:hypothetical protein